VSWGGQRLSKSSKLINRIRSTNRESHNTRVCRKSGFNFHMKVLAFVVQDHSEVPWKYAAPVIYVAASQLRLLEASLVILRLPNVSHKILIFSASCYLLVVIQSLLVQIHLTSQICVKERAFQVRLSSLHAASTLKLLTNFPPCHLQPQNNTISNISLLSLSNN
jgi:hypothetical protein